MRRAELSHRETTAAAPAEVWQWYVAVDRWARWDGGVSRVELDGPFASGTQGRVVLPNGRRARLRLLDVTPGESFTDVVRLPLLTVRTEHVLRAVEAGTEVTHTVQLRGLLARFFPRLTLIPVRRSLPTSVAQLAFLAARGTARRHTA